jgi:hypothetical protein
MSTVGDGSLSSCNPTSPTYACGESSGEFSVGAETIVDGVAL